MHNWRNKGIGGVRLIDLPDKDIRGKKKVHIQSRFCQALECRLCTKRYSREDVMDGTYRIETLICSHCYVSMQKSPHSLSCFGKPTFRLLSGKMLYGYDPESRDCNHLCPDRNICKIIVRPDLVGITSIV